MAKILSTYKSPKLRRYLYCDGGPVNLDHGENPVNRMYKSPVMLAGFGCIAAKYLCFFITARGLTDPNAVASIASTIQSNAGAASALGDVLALAFTSCPAYLYLSKQSDVIEISPYWGGNPVKAAHLITRYAALAIMTTGLASLGYTYSKFAFSFSAVGNDKLIMNNFSNSLALSSTSISVCLLAMAGYASENLWSGRWKVISGDKIRPDKKREVPVDSPAHEPSHSSYTIHRPRVGTPLAL